MPRPVLQPGDEIVLGFDGGKTDDATAPIAIGVSDAVAFKLGVWERPDGPTGDDWEVNREGLMRTILDGKVGHDGDLTLRRHLLNARRRTTCELVARRCGSIRAAATSCS